MWNLEPIKITGTEGSRNWNASRWLEIDQPGNDFVIAVLLTCDGTLGTLGTLKVSDGARQLLTGRSDDFRHEEVHFADEVLAGEVDLPNP